MLILLKNRCYSAVFNNSVPHPPVIWGQYFSNEFLFCFYLKELKAFVIFSYAYKLPHTKTAKSEYDDTIRILLKSDPS